MGRQGVFSPYPFSPLWAFGTFIAGRVLRGVGPERGVRTPSDGTGRNDATDVVIMAVMGIEASVRLLLPSPIIGALGPSAASTLHLLAFFVSSPPSRQAAPFSTPLFLRELPTQIHRLAMASWYRSEVSRSRMDGLVKRRLLCSQSVAEEWLLPGREELPAPRDGYIISFTHFHERGFGMPPHPLFCGLLHHYKIELQHLNPNGIHQIAPFIVLCEGFLGIEPHFELWRYFFAVSLVNKRDGSTEPIGCVGIHLRGPRAREYMAIATMKSNKGWHSWWFYVKNVDADPLPLFIGRTIAKAPPE
jgi:hypothetical protein